MKISFIIICVVPPALSHANDKKNSLVGFQGIPWLSNIRTVNERITGSYIRDSCQGKDRKSENKLRQIYKRENSSCKSVIVDEYRVANINLSLTATFNYQNQLKNIALYFKPSLSFTEDESIEECNVAYQKILDLLEIRYDESIGVNNGSPYWLFEKFDMRAWILNPTEIWIRKSYSKKSTDSFINCNVEVNYGPRISEDASKL